MCRSGVFGLPARASGRTAAPAPSAPSRFASSVVHGAAGSAGRRRRRKWRRASSRPQPADAVAPQTRHRRVRENRYAERLRRRRKRSVVRRGSIVFLRDETMAATARRLASGSSPGSAVGPSSQRRSSVSLRRNSKRSREVLIGEGVQHAGAPVMEVDAGLLELRYEV